MENEKKFTEELIDLYADKLYIGLTREENKMILDEFAEIDETIDLINKIPNIEKVEPYSWCLERCITDLREDIVEETLGIEEILANTDVKTDREPEIPKVVE